MVEQDVSHIVCKACDVSEIIDLRHRILRSHMPREVAFFEGDNEPATAHFAGYRDGIPCACVTIMFRPYESQPAWQLRGMAVEADLRGTGVGTQLIQLAINHAKTHTTPTLIWCNARQSASGFYQKQSFQIVSDLFHIPTAGPHYRMKLLLPS